MSEKSRVLVRTEGVCVWASPGKDLCVHRFMCAACVKINVWVIAVTQILPPKDHHHTITLDLVPSASASSPCVCFARHIIQLGCLRGQSLLPQLIPSV